MRASTAYFVGAGTIVAAIAIGLGGGIVAGNIMNPIAPKQGPDTSKVAQRTEAPTAPTTSAPSERVNYLTGSQAFGAMIAAPARAEAKPEAARPDTQTTQANAEPPAPQPSQAAAVEPPKPASSPPAAKPAEQQASTEPSSSSNNAYAKARDSDVKRAATERRRAERRERWAERRHYEFREPRGMRDRTDWDDVARNIREDSDARDFAGRPRGGFPQIRLFGPDDD
ncbi:type IV secretory pathway VirB10-like protein [Bradyrhizobium sp. USDA 4354]